MHWDYCETLTVPKTSIPFEPFRHRFDFAQSRQKDQDRATGKVSPFWSNQGSIAFLVDKEQGEHIFNEVVIDNLFIDSLQRSAEIQDA